LQKTLRQTCVLAGSSKDMYSEYVPLSAADKLEKQQSVVRVPTILVNGNFWTASSEILFQINV